MNALQASLNASKPVETPSFLRQIVALAFEQGRAWRILAAAAIVESLVALLSPWIASRVLDTAIPSAARSTLQVLALVTVVAAAHIAVATWFHKRTSIILSHRLEAGCLSRILTQYLDTPYARLQGAQYGDTHETLASAAVSMVTLLGCVVQVMTLSASVLASLGMLAIYQPGLALVTVGLTSIIALVTVLLSLRENRSLRELLAASSLSHELLHVLIAALPTLRASGATDRLVSRWVRLVRDQTAHSIQRQNIRLDRSIVEQLGQRIVTWIATAWLVQQTLESDLSLGVLMTCTVLVGNFLNSSLGVTQTWVDGFALRPHLERVDGLLRLAAGAAERRQLSANETLYLADRGLQLQGVSFRYAGSERWILQDYTHSFPGNQHTVLRAASGTGKSTILRLLAGLLAPEQGRVSVFGQDPCTCVGLVAYIPQQSSLLEASIGTNLTTLSGASLEQALLVGQSTGLEHMLASLPMGAETLVSAGGSNLSAGQRQLILLTAVFSGTHPVVLLDEATSQLDQTAQARINWQALCAGRTVISVRH